MNEKELQEAWVNLENLEQEAQNINDKYTALQSYLRIKRLIAEWGDSAPNDLLADANTLHDAIKTRVYQA